MTTFWRSVLSGISFSAAVRRRCASNAWRNDPPSAYLSVIDGPGVAWTLAPIH